LLKWDITKNTVGMNEENPLSTQLLVIDEFSMVDSLVFAKLLKASRHVVKILMIGDDQQLPPVGCGAVLKDLMKSHVVPTITLEHIYRQSEGSGIIKLAHAVRHNAYEPSLIHCDDIHMVNCFNYEVPFAVKDIINQALNEGYSMDDIQVLAPMYNGVAGIDALNETIQETVNPHDPEVEELKVGRRTFRVGDKILQLKNRVDENVFNGDIGTLTAIEHEDKIMHTPDTLLVSFDDQDVEYDPDHFREITHAFCMSVHKSQGNEFPIVIMSVLPDYRIMMRKNLLYTGLTRAKRALYLVGDEMAFEQGLGRDRDTNRATTLTMRLLKDSHQAKETADEEEATQAQPAFDYGMGDMDDKIEF
jgi:exodeoxyribonuclease V alpha subunit